jgi:hypothetical protein
MEREADNGMGWRQSLKESLSDLGVFWLDPTQKPTDIGAETLETKQELLQARAARDYDAVHKLMRIIRCVDLRLVDISDFLILHLDPDTPSYGSWEEVAQGNRQKKPIIVHVKGGKERTPLWLLAMLPHQLIFSTWDEVHHYLRHIAHDAVIDRLNRWYFFNFHTA